MWIILGFLSATLLGFYDIFKKQSLKENAVLPVLFINTLCSSLIFLPLIVISHTTTLLPHSSIFYVPEADLSTHLAIFLKSIIVLSSWIFGYFGLKHLPITLVGPINATRPVMVLIGAILLFHEQLNLIQFLGVGLTIISFILLSYSGKKEGINFKTNKWVLCIIAAAICGAISGLYDKHLMKSLNPILVQSWYNVYQALIMLPILFGLWFPKRKATTPFQWRWTILLIPIFLSAADFAYFYALNQEEAMISIISMIRRGSVLVSFSLGLILFKEKNFKSKAFNLLLILIGMILLYLGS